MLEINDEIQLTMEIKAQSFVKTLLSKGETAACDETADCFNRKIEELPSFYDEKSFKRGQRLYHENIYSCFGATFFGLVAVLSVPSILKVLISTKQSGTDFDAYKRYRATVWYYRMWHDYTFGPNSDLWKTLNAVRNLHNAASKTHHNKGQPRISQKDMALTQFGFMGLHLVRPKYFGLDHVTDKDWKAYMHFWRVLGWILGIDDRFNICRESLEETKQICCLLVDEFNLYYQKQDKDFLAMTKYLCDGLWHINITLNYNVVMLLQGLILDDDLEDKKNRVDKLSIYEKLIALYHTVVLKSMKFGFMRQFWNFKQLIELWFADHFPVWAILDYGYSNSFVYILGKHR